MSVTKSYVEALTARIVRLHPALGEDIVRPVVTDILREVQHRIYQDAIANLSDLARDLSPETARTDKP